MIECIRMVGPASPASQNVEYSLAPILTSIPD